MTCCFCYDSAYWHLGWKKLFGDCLSVLESKQLARWCSLFCLRFAAGDSSCPQMPSSHLLSEAQLQTVGTPYYSPHLSGPNHGRNVSWGLCIHVLQNAKLHHYVIQWTRRLFYLLQLCRWKPLAACSQYIYHNIYKRWVAKFSEPWSWLSKSVPLGSQSNRHF